jgi:hypothetical protein
MTEALRDRTGGLLKEKYVDFRGDPGGGAATVRRIQIGLGLWRPDGRAVCSSCANGGRGSANWCRLTAVRTTGLKAEDRAAR